METKTKTLTTYGNCALVQLEVRPASEFSFKPGGPEIINGGLIISEASGNGVVGSLLAVNNTGSFLLLTDADLLSGAKQNRVLNKSVLLEPYSKTQLDVSCIERGRWHYTTPDFSSSPSVADAALRITKALQLNEKISKQQRNLKTQQSVWSQVSYCMRKEGFASVTENYSDLVVHREKKQKTKFPATEPENGCNGLAVLIDGKPVNIDIFGTEDVYRHYFPKLRNSAFLQARVGNDEKAMDSHEAFFKVLDLLDRFEITERTQDPEYRGAGSLFTRDGAEFLGFELETGGQLIHCGLFGK
jgi:hypothetical protein